MLHEVEGTHWTTLQPSCYPTAGWVHLHQTWIYTFPDHDWTTAKPGCSRQQNECLTVSEDSLRSVTCSQWEPSLICEENRAPMANLLAPVFSQSKLFHPGVLVSSWRRCTIWATSVNCRFWLVPLLIGRAPEKCKPSHTSATHCEENGQHKWN